MQSQLPSFEDVVYHSLYNISLVYPTCWKCVPDGSEVTGHVGIFGHSSYTKSKRGSVEGKRLQASTFASVSGREHSSIDSLGASSSDSSTSTGQSEHKDGTASTSLNKKGRSTVLSRC